MEKNAVGGRGYNRAVQPKDIVLNPKRCFDYWYISGDPLYRISGRLLRNNLVVFPQASKSTFKNHSLENFKGLTVQNASKKGGKAGLGAPDSAIE